MLYERWRQIADERPGELALGEGHSGRRWTFAQLAAAVDQLPVTDGPYVWAQGHTPEFVFEVLRAWRDQAVLCPLEAGQPRPVLPVPPPPATHLKLTSATTGPARAVAFTGEQLAADAENIVATMGLRPDWPNLGVISLAHSYGFSNLVLPLLLQGIPLFIVASPLPEILRRAAAGFSAITLAAVPALWRTWHETGAIPEATRLAISAGAPLPVTLEQAVFLRAGLKIHNFYGATECGGIAYDATLRPRTDDADVGSAMRQVTLGVNDSGCLRVASRAVGQGYWPIADETLGQGSFQTGDLAQLAAGRVYLRGRVGDQINVAGRKISPAAIEQVLATHPAVHECLVLGVASRDAERTEIIAACVVAREHLSVADLKQFLLARLPAWQVPREWRLVASLGTNARGKISRAEWRKTFQASE